MNTASPVQANATGSANHDIVAIPKPMGLPQITVETSNHGITTTTDDGVDKALGLIAFFSSHRSKQYFARGIADAVFGGATCYGDYCEHTDRR